jgi:hypothetical protein
MVCRPLGFSPVLVFGICVDKFGSNSNLGPPFPCQKITGYWKSRDNDLLVSVVSGTQTHITYFFPVGAEISLRITYSHNAHSFSN